MYLAAEGQDISKVPVSDFRYNSVVPKIGQDKLISFRELNLLHWFRINFY